MDGTIPKGYNLYNNNCTFISPINTFPWRENIIVYTPNQGTNREKYLNHIVYQRRDANSAGKKHLSIHFFLLGPRLFHASTQKIRLRSLENGHQSGYSRADTKNKNINKKIKDFSIRGKTYYNMMEKNLKYGKIKFIILKDSCLHATSIKSTVGNKLGVFPSPLHVSTS